jgi:rare lipoprotein A
MSVSGLQPCIRAGNWSWRGAASLGAAAFALAGCADPHGARVSYSHGHEHFSQARYGHASPKVVADGRPVPHGGGQYLVGRPYTVAGHRYVPSENPSYTAVGMASWYGAAFHGRRTANGEVYDMASLSAAHPTMPLPSYARVTNLGNGYSVIVRVNDRGPYHAGRVMDVSSRVADILDMKGMGTARVKVDYVGPAPIQGSDDSQLLATLRTDGSPANLIGFPSAPTMVAQADTQTEAQSIWSLFSGGGGRSPSPQASPEPPAQIETASRPAPEPKPEPVRLAAAPPAPPVDSPAIEPPRDVGSGDLASGDDSPRAEAPLPPLRQPRGEVPLPPSRPFDLGANRSSALVVAAAAPAHAHAILPPRRPELHASAGKALYFDEAGRLPDKRGALRALERVKPPKARDK